MSSCGRARELFGAFWDDEVTRAEREWLDGHFRACAACRTEYEQYAHTLEAVGQLPRAEAAPDLAARALAAARRSAPAPDVIFVRETPRWVPVTAAAAAVLLVVATVAPWVSRAPNGLLARRDAPVPEARLVAARVEAPATPGAPAASASGHVVAAVVDSLFDHSEDIDFVLDPVSVRGGRAHAGTRLPDGVQGEQTVITF